MEIAKIELSVLHLGDRTRIRSKLYEDEKFQINRELLLLMGASACLSVVVEQSGVKPERMEKVGQILALLRDLVGDSEISSLNME